MIDRLKQLKEKDNTVKEFVETVRQGIPSAVFGVSESFKNFLVSNLTDKVIYVVKDNLTAYTAVNEISEFSGKKAIFVPAKDEVLLRNKAFSKDGLYERIKALYEIKEASVIVVTAETLMQTCPKEIYSVKLEKDKDADLDKVIKRLVRIGYRSVEGAESKGTFFVRGDVLDVYPVNNEHPVRIDFFGDTVESIKTFDEESRKSLGYLTQVEILQASEFVFINDDYERIKTILKKEKAVVSKEGYQRLSFIIDEVETAIINEDLDAMSVLSSVSADCGSIFDYIEQNTVMVIDESKSVYDTAMLSEREFNERYISLKNSGEIFSFEEKNLTSVAELSEKLKKYRITAVQSISTAIPFFNPLKIINPSVSGISNYQLDFKEVFNDINNWLYSGYSVLVCTGNSKRSDMFSSDLSGYGIASTVNGNGELNGVCITDEKLTCGFIYHEEKTVVIGSGNLFGKSSVSKRVRSKRQNFFTAPEVGDYCVHEVHGIGRVLGNKKITSTEGTKDYVSVEYSGGDILYVPVEQMDILTRYLGGDKHPKLSKIGGVDFERIKKAVRESIKKMSFDLKRLYSERQEVKGVSFNVDEDLEKAFISAFPFEDTLDQITANDEIRNEMQSGKVMDRLICGDVGFGKTEVAFRAIFRAIVNGKQVAMLAPTTILSTQHYNTAIERFKGFGIKIGLLNRLKTPSEIKKTLLGLKTGEIDFVIGTHRLLSADVEYKNLGLLVLDEEQRFGVEHKEKIKLLKKDVDALTLTATPIPRTLHMSLTGIREISVINTPPKKRLPVQVYVTEETDVLIKDAITREINRGGQAFILYNRVESIFTFSERIRRILPNIRMTVCHGQMDERTMEKNIMAFYGGESDLLISTTIIENGIDLPRANTLIVIDADNLGLSTLYQLKGRVGRSDRLAYAYFTYKREKILSTTAYERLNAIIEFTEMGSGIKIAMRDLEIRGAGNILGAEQHGHMDKIGYELYSKLLREEISGREEKIPELDIRINAYIPEKYIESNVARMDAYKEIAEINSAEGEKSFIEETESIYGKLPKEAENLIKISLVKIMAMKVYASAITVKKSEVSIAFESFNELKDGRVMGAVNENKDEVRLTMTSVPKVEFKRDGENNEEMIDKVKKFLEMATK